MSAGDTSLQAQQLAWLEEAHPGLFAVAFGITGDPTKAEDAVSVSSLGIVQQIVSGKVKADNTHALFAYARETVRNQSKSAIGAGRRNQQSSVPDLSERDDASEHDADDDEAEAENGEPTPDDCAPEAAWTRLVQRLEEE